jgi:rod shape-determining protein MreC
METSRDDFVIAIRSAFLKKETQQRFSILGLIFFSVIFLVLGTFNYKPINYVKKIINEIVYRSSFIVSVPENIAQSTYRNIINHFSHYNQHNEMKDELEELRSKNTYSEIRILENIRYKKLIDDYFVKENETIAKVLIDKQSPFLRSIIINKGSQNNIKLGMIALNNNYLVGKVVQVNYSTSRVLLISDINSKIPVSLQPGDIQAIMSGKNKSQGSIQYSQDLDLNSNNLDELIVTTSGAGEVFVSGIPIGKISNKKDNYEKTPKEVNFYNDFSQLKYVKIVSFLKKQDSVDQLSKSDSEKIDEKIKEQNQKQETLRILIEQKKIADEVRVKIEEENINLKKELLEIKREIKKKDIEIAAMKFIELENSFKAKCKKTMLNDLYKIGTEEYKACILNKGKKIN